MTQVSIPKSNDQILRDAQEDFDNILAGKPPKNSVRDPDKPDLADGGTIFYVNDHYKITIQKKMTDQRGIHGYLYGPIIVFNDIMEDGKPKELRNVRFYSGTDLMKLLNEKPGKSDFR